MSTGPGKYDDEATALRERAKASMVVVVVIGGSKGTGFSVQGPMELTRLLPGILEDIADQVRADVAER